MSKKIKKANKFSLNNMPIVAVIRDIKNYVDWIKTIDKEKANPNSLWYRFNMKHNFFYTIYFPITLPDEDVALPDKIKRLRVVESLAPVHRYLDEDLQFAEYIVPEFNQFYDEDNKPTLVYGIVYRFAFKRLNLKYVISRLLFWGVTIWALFKYPVIEWLKNLI